MALKIVSTKNSGHEFRTVMANPGRKYQHHSVARKREIVEASLRGDESVAVVAREYGVNANQIWAWRKLYSEGRLDNGPVLAGSSASTLLAVDVIEGSPAQPVTASHGGCLEITVGQARLRATGAIDPELLRVALAALRP